MGVEPRRNRAEPEGEDGGERRGQAHHEQRVQAEDLPERHRHRDLGEPGEREHDPDRAGHHQHPAAEPVEQAADGRAEQPHRQAARHHQEPGLQGGEPAQALQVERQQDHRAEHRHERHRHEDQRDGVGALAQGAQVEQRHAVLLQPQLAQHEAEDGDQPGHHDRDGHAGVAALEPAEPVDQAAETGRGGHHAEPVDAAALGLADILQPLQAAPRDQGGDGQHHGEQQAPGAELQDHAGDRRAHRGRDRHGQSDVAHHPAAVLLGHHPHQGGHQQRHHHGRPGRLDDAGDQQHGERRRRHRQRGAEQEQPHRGGVGGPGGHTLEEPTGDRDDRGHGQHEGGRKPLRALLGDVQRRHQPRNGVDHDRLVENDHERGQHQQTDHGRRAAGRGGRGLGG